MSSPRLLAAMAAHLPRLPFLLLFVFLAVHVPASHGESPKLQATYETSMCSDSFMCGSVNITYPFYLSNATRETTTDYSGNYSCGYTDLEISCQDRGAAAKIPVIRLGDHNYTIQNIFYESRTIILADSDVLVPGKCPAVGQEVSFDEVWLHYNISNYDNLFFFIDCKRLGDTMENYTINCAGSRPQNDGFFYVFTSEELYIALEQELSVRCGENFTVPVQRDVLMRNDPNMLARGGYVAVLQAGFELEWNRRTPETDQCYRCEESGGRCAYGQNQDKTFLGCLCSEGKVGSPNCNNSGGWNYWNRAKRKV